MSPRHEMVFLYLYDAASSISYVSLSEIHIWCNWTCYLEGFELHFRDGKKEICCIRSQSCIVLDKPLMLAEKPVQTVYTGLLLLFESSNGNRAEIHKLKVFIDPLKKLKNKLTWHNIFCGCNGITTEISAL